MIFNQIDLFEPDKFFHECHAAYITEMPSRKLFVTFFGGSKDKAKDVGSYLVKKHICSNDNWSSPKLFVKEPNKATGSAFLFVAPEKNEIWVFYNLMQGKGYSMCNTVRHIYKNGCWQKRDYLRRMIGWNSRGKIVVLDNGDYVHAMHDELLGYKAYFQISNNKGRTWKIYGPVKTKKGCLEPAVVQLNDGRLLCFLRTKEREIYQSISSDRGKHWMKAISTGIPNPDSEVELLKLPNGNILLAYNHSSTKRNPLNVRFSIDNAQTWSKPKIIAESEGKESFSYPCMIYGSDNNIHMVYTNSGKTIRYAKFDEEWLYSA
jgi:predicted neuraminidase